MAALSALARQRAAALQRGLPLLGLKPLGARLKVTERSARRIAQGSRGTTAANEQRIARLWKTYGARVNAVARTPPPRPGRRPVPRFVITVGELARLAAEERSGSDPDLAASGERALLEKLGLPADEPASIATDAAGDVGRSAGAMVGLYVGEANAYPEQAEHAVGFFIVQEYRQGRHEMFCDVAVMPPGAPTFEAATLGLARTADGDVILANEGEGRLWGGSLATNWREAYSVIDAPDIQIGPSFLRTVISADEMIGARK